MYDLKPRLAHVASYQFGDDPARYSTLDPAGVASREDIICQRKRRREAITGYLMAWDDCPLLDQDEQPQTWFRQRKMPWFRNGLSI